MVKPMRRAQTGPRRAGFTLIELLVVMAILSTLLSIGLPRYYDSVKRAEEATLKQNLALLREAIDKHYADTGRYPMALQDLVDKRYLRHLPRDPVTDSAETWAAVAPPSGLPGRVYDVKSGSEALARDGSAFNTW